MWAVVWPTTVANGSSVVADVLGGLLPRKPKLSGDAGGPANRTSSRGREFQVATCIKTATADTRIFRPAPISRLGRMICSYPL